MSSILFKPQPTEIEGYAHGQQDVLLRFAVGSIPSGLTVKVYSGLGQTLMPGFAPVLAAAGLTDAVFLRWTQSQKQAMSAYSSLWIELIWDGVCQLAGPLRMNLSPAAGPEVGLVTVRTRTSGDVYFYADQLISLALSIQADVTTKLGQINAVKQHVDQQSDHVDEQTDHVDEQAGHVDNQKSLVDQAKLHIDNQAAHVDEQTDHVDGQKTLIDQAKQHIDNQAAHVDEQTDHVDGQKTLVDQAKLHIDNQAAHVDEQTDHVDGQRTLVDQAKLHIDNQAAHVDAQTGHVDSQKTLIDQAKQHIDNQAAHVDEQTDHVDNQKTLIDQQKALIDQTALLVAQNAQTATDQAGIAVANRFVFKGSYQNNTVYTAGDGVMYANSFIRRKTSGNSGNTFVPGDWDFLAMGINLRGNWQANTYYALNDLVIFRRSAYLAPANLTTGASFSRNNWVRIASGWNPAGAWTANTAVYEDDILTNQGSTYRVTTDHTTPATFTTTNLELIAAKGDPGTLTASAFTQLTLPLSATDQLVIQRADNTLGKISMATTGYPDIRPTLGWDFANSRFVSPLIPLSRNSAGSRINHLGILETLGVNIPRLEYDPLTLACLGLLDEGEQRTNLHTYSQQADSVFWGKFNCLVELSGLPNIDNTNSVWKITNNGTGAIWTRIRQGITATVGTTYTASTVFTAGNVSYAAIVISDGGNNTTIFNLTGNGSVTSAAAGVTARIKPLGNGRYRCEATYTVTTTSVSINYGPAVSNGTNTNVGDYVYASSMQAEAGTFATSYMLTQGSAFTRGRDIINVPLGSWFNPSEGTILCSYRRLSDYTATSELWKIWDGTNNNAITQYAVIAGAQARQTVSVAGVQQYAFTQIYAAAGLTRVALAYKAGDFAGCSNGGTVQTNTTGAMPAGLTSLTFGGAGVIIADFRYWPKRLPSTQLQLLSQL